MGGGCRPMGGERKAGVCSLAQVVTESLAESRLLSVLPHLSCYGYLLQRCPMAFRAL
jgi:hypothetical protein